MDLEKYKKVAADTAAAKEAAAIATKAEEEARQKQETEHAVAEGESKFKELEQERAGVKQKLESVSSELASAKQKVEEATTFAETAAKELDDATRAEFEREFNDLKTNLASLESRAGDLRVRKEALDATLSGAEAAKAAGEMLQNAATFEGRFSEHEKSSQERKISEEMLTAFNSLNDKQWENQKFENEAPPSRETCFELLSNYKRIIENPNLAQKMGIAINGLENSFGINAILKNNDACFEFVKFFAARRIPTFDQVKTEYNTKNPDEAKNKPDYASFFALGGPGGLAERLYGTLAVGDRVRERTIKEYKRKRKDDLQRGGSLKLEMGLERQADIMPSLIWEAAAKELTSALEQQKGDYSAIMDSKSFPEVLGIIKSITERLKKSGADASQLLHEATRLAEEFLKQMKEQNPAEIANAEKTLKTLKQLAGK